MRTIEETRALSTIDPELDQLLKNGFKLPPSWDSDTHVQEIRVLLDGISESQRRNGPDPSTLPYTEEDRQITVRDGASITIRIHKPRSAPVDGCPGMVMCHGGGFCVGNLESGSRLCRVFAEKLGGVAVNVGYRLAPEHPFPTPIHDCLDALRWTSVNLQSLDINSRKGLLAAGESAGADIALGIAHLWTAARTSPPLTGIYNCATSASNAETVPERYKGHLLSFEQNADAPMQTIEAYEVIQRNYKPDPKSHLAFPVAIPDPSIMPKTYFQACGWDVMRDCTLIIDQVWRDAGVKTRLDVYPGMPHAFWILELPIAQMRKFEEDTVAGLRWLLEFEEDL